MDKLSLATLAGSSNRCSNGGDDGDWNDGNGCSSLQSSESLWLVSSDSGDEGDEGNKEKGKLEHFGSFVFVSFLFASMICEKNWNGE